MNITTAAVCAVGVFLVVSPALASWPYIVASALPHVGYSLFLVRTYRTGDLGQTYPIARGSSPVLVTLGAAIFAGELPGLVSIAGVLLVSRPSRRPHELCGVGMPSRCRTWIGSEAL